MNSRIATTTFALVLSLAAGTAATAQQGEPLDTLPRYLLEEVTVTVTRAPTRSDRTTQKVELIGPADLARTPGNELTDILKKNSAVDVIQFPGLLSGVSIRGFRPQYSGINPRTLILVNGRPAGANNLSTLGLGDVERIEVLRGPASALYGSSAMGGVVNVITRTSTGPLSGRATLGYGSFDSYRADVAAGGQLGEAIDFDLTLSSFGQRSGYRTGSGRALGGGEVVKRLDAGGEQQLEEFVADTLLAFSEHAHRSGSVRVGYAITPGWRLDARGSSFIADAVQNPGDVHASYDSRSLKDVDRVSGELGISGSAGAHSILARVYRTEERVAYYDRPEGDAFVNFRTPTRWDGLQLQDALALGDHSVVFGLDYGVARARSERYLTPGEPGAPYSPNSSIASTAGFAEGTMVGMDGRLIGTLGARLDRVAFDVEETELLVDHRANRETHTVLNPSAGVRYNAHNGFSLRVSGGRAFVTPDAFNVAGYSESAAGERAVNLTRGNPLLRPESSVSWDVGAGFTRAPAGVQADLTYFHTDVRDRITTQVATSGELTPGGDTIRSVTTYMNVDRAEIRGIEAALSYDLGVATGRPYSLRVFASGARLLTAEQISDGERSPILNVAATTINAGIEFDDQRRLATRLGSRFVGERNDQDFSDWMNPGTITFPSFLVHDAAADLRLGDRYELGLRIENLTDENYYEVRGYPLPGRSLRLQIGVAF